MKQPESVPEHRGLVQSVERAVLILKCFEQKEALGLTEISRMTGLHKSTVFGLAATLEQEGFLRQDAPNGKYSLGVETFRLGCHVNRDLRRIAAPSLDRLASRSGETVNFVVPDGEFVVYVDKRESIHSMRIAPDMGKRRPMYLVATGKSILAALPEDRSRDILARTNFSARTDRTLLSPAAVLEQLREIRRLGYATNRQELDYDRVGIAAAVLDSNGCPVAAVSVCGPVSRMNEAVSSQAALWVMDCAREISSRL